MNHSPRPAKRIAPPLLLALSLLAVSCQGTRPSPDATVRLLSRGGPELGVSTDYGIVFLGRGQQAGSVEFDTWFGDGPSRESGVIETLGDGLYVTEAEIRIPEVPLTFKVPGEGQQVEVIGRVGAERHHTVGTVTSHSDVSGLLLQMRPGTPRFDPSQVGAGVYVKRRGRTYLVGLVSGCVGLPGPDGEPVEYVAVVGPERMWRVVTHGRNWGRGRHRVYREDIL